MITISHKTGIIIFAVGTFAEKLVRKVTTTIDIIRIKGVGKFSRTFRADPSILDMPELSLAVDRAKPPPSNNKQLTYYFI